MSFFSENVQMEIVKKYWAEKLYYFCCKFLNKEQQPC